MRKRLVISLAVVVSLLAFGAVGVYAYDASRDDLIANGVTIAGFDVGGMRAGEARSLLESRLADPVSRPLTVEAEERRFTLSAQRARIEIDVEGMVQDALGRSRDGSMVARTVRGLTGGSVDESVEAEVAWSETAVDRLVRRVKKRVDRDAENAEVSFSASGIEQVEGRNGLAVRGKELTRAINEELGDPEADRVVSARTKVTKPDVTTDELAAKNPDVIIINRGGFQLRHYENLELVETYRIAVGQVGLETPAGLYHIQNKAVDPAWHVPNSDWAGDLAGQVIPGGRADNPLKARWMGIYNGAGIHGTDAVGSLGTAASHGCIRMAIPEVKDLFSKVEVGAPVYIA
ncbi:MAG: L,D-transpeptidase family protein [Thermoleophilaceae bacterium]